MRLSTGLMARGRLGTSELLRTVATTAERLGLHTVWFGDHVVYPVSYSSRYPGHDGVISYRTDVPQDDVVVAMTWVLAATERVRVNTSLIVLALRQPVLLAKQLATLDQLSGGRVAIGVGVGWLTEEFAPLGVSPDRRGARADEYVEVLRTCWTEEQPSFEGEFLSFPPIYCNPKPAQPGGIPIWVGGVTDAALRRVARYGAGWLPQDLPADEITAGMDRIRGYARDYGRDGARIEVSASATQADREGRARRVAELVAAGVDEIVVPVRGKTPEEASAFLESLPELLP